MADLLKERARGPVMENAVSIGSQTFSKNKVAYRIDLLPRGRDAHDYHVVLTRDEMLQIVASWMAAEARDAVNAAKAAALSAAGQPEGGEA